jgi:hypothetical protein
MAAASYIPDRDEDARAWFVTFIFVLSQNKALYQVSDADCVAIQAAVDAYTAALAALNVPGGRTPLATDLKTETRAAAEQICRQYAQMIRLNAGISDQAKLNLQINLVNNSRVPLPDPTSYPVLNIVGSMNGSMTLEYSDSLEPDKKKRPVGAARLELFVAIAAGPVTDPAEAKYLGSFTRQPIGVPFAHADNGKTATFFARWAGTRSGVCGPWSVPVSMTIAA